jgi:hypothetical protein
MSEAAIEFSRSRKLTTIWDLWHCDLYDYRNKPSNPMRCIHNDPKKRTIFYENMSAAFAAKARGIVTVMHSAIDYQIPPVDGIWGRIELPKLKLSKGVESVSLT